VRGANARIDEGGLMAGLARLRFRSAGAKDAVAIAKLHAESWRKHYRGAYSDSFLDGDVLEDRGTVWSERLRGQDGGSCTVLAETDAGIVGFAHGIFNADLTWGTLLDNLHVSQEHKRGGVGTELLALIADAAVERGTPLYLWVLEQNVAARAFYESRGAAGVERAPVSAPGGVASRLIGTPTKLRYVWADPRVALAYRVTNLEVTRR
jgi:GNAT superfamily N-acetyltransferase